MKQEYHRALEQICLSEEARARIISVLEQKERGQLRTLYLENIIQAENCR